MNSQQIAERDKHVRRLIPPPRGACMRLAEEVAESGGGDRHGGEGRGGTCGTGRGPWGGAFSRGGRADKRRGDDHGNGGRGEDLGLQLPCHRLGVASFLLEEEEEARIDGAASSSVAVDGAGGGHARIPPPLPLLPPPLSIHSLCLRL